MNRTLVLTWMWMIPLIIGLFLLLPEQITNNCGWYFICFVIGGLGYLITDKLIN